MTRYSTKSYWRRSDGVSRDDCLMASHVSHIWFNENVMIFWNANAFSCRTETLGNKTSHTHAHMKYCWSHTPHYVIWTYRFCDNRTSSEYILQSIVINSIMGSSSSTELSDETIDEIRQNTRFSKREIIDMYEKFHTDFPEGVITRRRFVDMYNNLFPDGDATRFAKHVFRAYDADGNGEVDFTEFMASLSIAAKGSVDEKLRWAFRLYDIDGDGEITRCESTEMIMVSCDVIIWFMTNYVWWRMYRSICILWKL